MDKAKVTKLLKSIDKAVRALAKETEATHISIYAMDNTVSITDYTDIEKPKFDYFNGKYGEDIKINE